MRRCIIVLLALAAVAAFGPARADAKSPCRDRIYNEWYRNGKVASTYPLSCYRDALKHIPTDVTVYTSLSDDIRLALQAAIDRRHGQHVPSEVGSGTGTRVTSSSSPSDGTSSTTPHADKTTQPTDTAPDAADPGDMSTTPSATPIHIVASTPTSTSSGGVPLPVLVLGGVALVLVASGGIGLGVRRYRRGHPG